MSVTAVERNRQLTIGVTVVCLGLSIISLVLRVRARLTTAAKLWWDDYWMMLVLAVCFGMSANDFVGTCGLACSDPNGPPRPNPDKPSLRPQEEEKKTSLASTDRLLL